MITEADKGWMAAVIDLRGLVLIKKNKQRATRQIVLAVESKKFSVIRRLCELSGTKADAKLEKPLREFMRRACAEHCLEPHVHVADDRIMPAVSRWTATGVGFAVIIDHLLPYLTEDQGFPELVSEVLGATEVMGRGSGPVMATLTRLRELGWPMPALLHEQLQFQLGFHELAGRSE